MTGPWLDRTLHLLRTYNSATPRIATLLNTPSTSSVRKVVTINGYVRSLRKHRKTCFAALGDGSTIEPLQVVLNPEQTKR